MTAGLRKFRRGAQAKLLRTQQAKRSPKQSTRCRSNVDPDGKVEMSTNSAKNFSGSIQALKFRHSLFLYLMNSSKTLFATDLLKKREKEKIFSENS